MDPLEKVTREDLWDWAGALRFELGHAGTHTGVVIPHDFTSGEVLDSSHARRIAAALILAADIHDRIYDRGWDDRGDAQEGVRDAMNSQIDQLNEQTEEIKELRELFSEVHTFLEELDVAAADRGTRIPRLNHIKRRVNEERARC